MIIQTEETGRKFTFDEMRMRMGLERAEEEDKVMMEEVDEVDDVEKEEELKSSEKI